MTALGSRQLKYKEATGVKKQYRHTSLHAGPGVHAAAAACSTFLKTETNLQQLCHDAADCIPDHGVSYYIVIPNLTVDNTIMSSTGALTVALEARDPSELVYVNGS